LGPGSDGEVVPALEYTLEVEADVIYSRRDIPSSFQDLKWKREKNRLDSSPVVFLSVQIHHSIGVPLTAAIVDVLARITRL
jgi:hypothetical protein